MPSSKSTVAALAEEPFVAHGSFSIERTYPASPERVFNAFRDPVKKRRWFAEGVAWKVFQFDVDFRVGGSETSRFSFRGGPEITNDTQYQDIIDNRRIVITYRMTIGGKPLSVSLATMEFFPDGKGTRVTYTEQGAYFDSAEFNPWPRAWMHGAARAPCRRAGKIPLIASSRLRACAAGLATCSDIQVVGEGGAVLDEAEARLGLRSHQRVDRFADGGAVAVADLDAQQRALLGIHRRLFELRGVHLAEALEAADVDLGARLELARDELVAMLEVARVDRLGAVGDLEQRRHGEEQVPVLDQRRHLLIEERDQQRGDVRAVDVGVGHDDDALVAQVGVVVLGAGADAERQDEIGEQLVLRQLRR